MRYLRLIRAHHLLIVAGIMYSIRYFMLEPILGIYGHSLISTDFEFSLMVFSVLLITGAASIINNYFDRKSDLLNRPNNVVVGTSINRRFAIILHSVLSFFGVIIGFYLCALAGHFWYGLSFIFITILFYLYSSYFKRRLLTGNIIISLLIAGITFLPWLTEYIFAKSHYTQAFPTKIYHHLMILSFGFSLAGFLLNMAREIIKDIIDFRGDYQYGSKTIPIIYGKKLSRQIGSLILTLSGIFIIAAWFLYLRNIPIIQHNMLLVIYLSIILVAPIFFLALSIHNAKKRKQLKRIISILQLLMLMGVLFSLVIFLNITFII